MNKHKDKDEGKGEDTKDNEGDKLCNQSYIHVEVSGPIQLHIAVEMANKHYI